MVKKRPADGSYSVTRTMVVTVGLSARRDRFLCGPREYLALSLMWLVRTAAVRSSSSTCCVLSPLACRYWLPSWRSAAWGAAILRRSYRAVARQSGRSTAWGAVGTLAIICVFVVLSFYTVLSGWTFDYFLRAITGEFRGSRRSGVERDVQRTHEQSVAAAVLAHRCKPADHRRHPARRAEGCGTCRQDPDADSAGCDCHHGHLQRDCRRSRSRCRISAAARFQQGDAPDGHDRHRAGVLLGGCGHGNDDYVRLLPAGARVYPGICGDHYSRRYGRRPAGRLRYIPAGVPVRFGTVGRGGAGLPDTDRWPLGKWRAGSSSAPCFSCF